MIGQILLRDKILKLKLNFPRFIILSGIKGSGKKLIGNFIAKELNATLVFGGLKIDEIRNIIKVSYTQLDKIIYYFDEADKMSINAKNALLKVLEEAPANAYFVLSTENLDNVLPTIKSRGTILLMDNYTIDELRLFSEKNKINFEHNFILGNIINTPGALLEFKKYKLDELNDYVDKVVNYIGEVSETNALKIRNKIEQSEWEYDIFINWLQYKFKEKLIRTKNKKYGYAIQECLKFKKNITNSSINKGFQFDLFLLNTRTVLS